MKIMNVSYDRILSKIRYKGDFVSFDERAKTWDASARRQALAEAVADAIKRTVPLRPSMHLLDIGAGTGLLTRRVLPYVKRITAVDTSEGMLAELKSIEGHIETYRSDIMAYDPPERFDGIVSSMTMHHIEDTQALFVHLFTLLEPGGFIALADLAPEDGTFHTLGNEGVFHFGFDETKLKTVAQSAGFVDISYRIIHTINKAGNKSYEVFLLTASKPYVI
jgi:predicted TPR repeat methyltransferase